MLTIRKSMGGGRKVEGLVSNSFWLGVRQISLRAGFLISSVVLARFLPIEEFTAYAYILMTINLFASYGTLGISVSTSKYFAIVSQGMVPEYSLNSLAKIFVSLLVFVVLLCFIAPSDLLFGSLNDSRYILIIGVIAFSMDVIPGGAAMGLEKYRNLALFSIATLFFILFGIYGALVSRSYEYALWVFIVAALLRASGSAYIVLKFYFREEVILPKARSSSLKAAVWKVGPVALVTVLSATGLWVGGWMHLNYGASPDQYALYAIGLQWFAVTLFVPLMISRTVIPKLVVGDVSAKYLSRCVQCSFISAVLVMCVGVLISQYLTSFYGDILVDSKYLIVCFMMCAIPYSIVNTIGNALVAQGEEWYWFITSCSYQLVFLVVTAAFIDYGAEIGAFSIAVAGCCQSILLFAKIKKMNVASDLIKAGDV